MKLGYAVVAILLVANAYQFLERPAMPQEGEAVLVTDDDYFSVAYSLIENANESLYVIAFEMKYYRNYPDSKPNQLVNALIAAERRGVDVRVVTDEYLNQYGDDATAVVRLLRANGVDAKLDGSERTTHAKVLVVDGTYVLIGSTNWSHTSMEKNAEANVLVRSRGLAKDMEAYFESLAS